MRQSTRRGAVVLAVLVLQSASLAQWTQVAPGISYEHLSLPGPVKVFITRADRDRQTWTIDSMTSKGTIKGGNETVPDMAARYDDTVTWDGRRYDVKVAINGDYYDRVGYALGGQVMGGWYVKRYNDDGGMSGFCWTADRLCGMGGDVHNGPRLQRVIFGDKGEMNVNALNTTRGQDELALYTSHWDATTGTDANGVEVLVRMDEPLAMNPKKPGNRGVILEIAENAGSTPIPFDCVVLSATGTAAPRLLQHVELGAAVHFDLRLEDVGVERINLKPAKWQNVWGSLGDTQNLLIDGQVSRHWEAKAAKLAAEGKKHGSVVKDPRTAVAYNKDYVFFIVVDGRSPESIGMTFTDVAEFCKNELKADYAVMQDGGGSSTMWVDGQVKNTPSGKGKDEKHGVLRAVANGYCIAVVQPAQFSKAFKPGAAIKAKAAGELRLGPGSQYAANGRIDDGAAVTILPHRLNGVLAKGGNWWCVKLGSGEGWVSESLLKN